jgi:3-hydroxyacyl-[acyl-carrier-protein] dehydratase
MSEEKQIQLPIDIKGILENLPHRYPFIMVDRILELEAGKTITGLKNVSMGEPFFQGHFPGEPVMPGVLILEGMAQVASVLAYLSLDSVQGKLVFFAGMDNVRFRKVVYPGDQLILKLEFVKQKRNIIKMTGKAYVDDVLVTEADLIAAFT